MDIDIEIRLPETRGAEDSCDRGCLKRNFGQELSQIVAGLSYGDLPPAVVQTTKRVILDSIGCALAAPVTDRARIALGMVAELGGNPQAVILGGGRTSWALAAYANAELIHALDFAAAGPHSHIVPFVISPCLAIAERQRSSGRELITAVALALEVGGRASRSVPSFQVQSETPPYYELNPRFAFGSMVVFGAVAGASNLLRLDSARIANAMGLAETSMPVLAGTNWVVNPGPTASAPLMMAKFNCLTGWIAQLSTTACLLAERGFTGDTTFLESEWGLGRVLGVSYFKPELLVDGLGIDWCAHQVYFKPYPCGGIHHAAIGLINELIEQNGIDPACIEEILVRGSDTMMRSPFARPFPANASSVDCQFSNAYIFAVAAFHGRNPGPYWQMPDTYRDPRILALSRRVGVEPIPRDDEFLLALLRDNRWPDASDAIVEIRANGNTYRAAGGSTVFGAAEQAHVARKPLSDDEIKAKFRDNASYSRLGVDRAQSVIDMVYSLEEVEDVTRLCRMLETDS